jgi:hypothetical protein
MKRNRSLLAVGLLAVLGLAGCARGVNTNLPDATVAPARDTTFCQGILAYRTATDGLNGDTLTANRAQARQLVQTAHDQAVALENVAPGDQKNNLVVVANAFDQLGRQLDKSSSGDPQVLVNTLIAAKQDPTVTAAATALDTYTSSSCGLNPYGTPTKGAVTTITTIVGPTPSTTH